MQRYVILPLSIAILLIGTLVCSCVSSKTHLFRNDKGELLQNSIAVLEKLKIGGDEQWILIRGKNINNPILFKIHGGPGQAEIATINYNKQLEENFVVVEWEQRGAGKSAKAIEPINDMTRQQLVEDTKEITEYLLKRLHQKKLILVGHSWGSAIGMMTIAKYPYLYSAFVSTGQIVNMVETQKAYYPFLLEQAKKNNNSKALKELADAGTPPDFYDLSQNSQRKIYLKWLEPFGAGWHSNEPLPRVKLMLSSVEYSLCEKLQFTKAASKSFEVLFPELMKIDLFSQVKKVDVPVYFALGKYDKQTPPAIALKYLEQLEAPIKKWQWFDKSAHFPQWEEPKVFHDFLVNTVLKDIQK